MNAEGVNQTFNLSQFGWVLEFETNLYIFACSDCAFAWLAENKPELFESEEVREDWHRARRWCSHDSIDYLVLSKDIIDIREDGSDIIISMKEAGKNV